MIRYIFLILGVAVYFFLHSWLASTPMKTKFIPPLQAQTYRLIYNFIALFALIPVLLLYRHTPEDKLFTSSWVSICGFVLLISSVALLYITFRGYSWGEFLGTTFSVPEQLNTSGLNAYVRHPLYFATLSMLVGWFLWMPYVKTLMVVAIGFFYILIGARLEEKKLLIQFGSDYLQYKQQVPFLWPRWGNLFAKKNKEN